MESDKKDMPELTFFKNATNLILEELHKVGGQLYTDSARKVVADMQIRAGREDVKKDLDTAEFARKLFGGLFSEDADKEKVEKFRELGLALTILESFKNFDQIKEFANGG